MALFPVQIKPGIYKELPSLTSEPTYKDSNLIRFKAGYPEKMGGWVDSGYGTLAGKARTMHQWRLNNGLLIHAIGTSEKVYLVQQEVVYDITPLRETDTLNGPFDTTLDSTTIVVNDISHGSTTGDYVTFSNATSTSFVDSEVNANHQITVIDSDSYSIEVATAATANSTGTGGAGVTAEYEIGIAGGGAVSGFGWSAGAWGEESWGDSRTVATTVLDLRIWSFDNFGQDLIMCYGASPLYQWVYNASAIDRATEITESPDKNDIVLVTDPDRHLISFATIPESGGSSQDRLLVRWADQETKVTWTALAENTAGELLLNAGSRIMTAKKSQQGTLIWTDASLHNMQYIGPPFIFGIEEVGNNCGAIGRNCAIANDNTAFWMGAHDFFVFDGTVQPIECSVHRYVFTDINRNQTDKIIAGLNKAFHEIIWFYPSSTSDENNRYVIFNYLERVWYIGTLARSAWLDSELSEFPYGIKLDMETDDSTLYFHEQGVDDDTSAMTSYIETNEFDIEQGDHFVFIRRLIPDMTISAGSVDFIFKTRRYPHSTQVTDTTLPVTSSTEKLDTRIRTRQLAIRMESDAVGDSWRAGLSRIDLRPAGRR